VEDLILFSLQSVRILTHACCFPEMCCNHQVVDKDGDEESRKELKSNLLKSYAILLKENKFPESRQRKKKE